jgi:ATP-dependent helicase HrpB
MVATIRQALCDNPTGSVLAFLPGQGEIHYCAAALQQWITDSGITGIQLHPLYGNLSIEAQQNAIATPAGAQAGERKVVLATNIAETSLTIEAVEVVVDSGLQRVARFDPVTGMSGLHTVRISRASSEQRAGRAGRLRPGKCYRLWSAEQQQQLAAHGVAEILSTDLAPLALQLLQWGIDNPTELRWLDPPPPGPWQQALDLLHSLGAIDRRGAAQVLNPHGIAMSALPAHPRLAHMLVQGATSGHSHTASLLAALLSERDPFRDEPDIARRLEMLDGKAACPARHKGWCSRARELARRLHRQLDKMQRPRDSTNYRVSASQLVGYLLACAYPDRIARRRHSGGYQLANGRSAGLVGVHALGKQRWLAVAEVSSVAGGKGDLIRSAAILDEALFDSALQAMVSSKDVAQWDRKAGRFVAEQQQRIGALVLHRQALIEVPLAAKRQALVDYLRAEKLRPLPWKDEQRQWLARVELLRSIEPAQGWPNFSEQCLLERLDDWLGPYLDSVTLLQNFSKLDLGGILEAQLSYQQGQRLQQLAPTRFEVPSGSAIKIDYSASPPVLAVKLQEMFGCEQTPTVAGGKVALVVHLLSPAGRPLQVTQDLAGFWQSSYHDVKKEMKGRYPKHPWPDDPLIAKPTRHAKPRR